jgi:hypothetical protein
LGVVLEAFSHIRFRCSLITRSELAFPSFASILPFLEAASPNNSKAWVISRAGSLEDYEALWIRSRRDDFYLLTMIAYSGDTLRSWLSIHLPDGQYYLILVPKAWLMEGWKVSEKSVSDILSTQHENRKAWTVNRTEMHF